MGGKIDNDSAKTDPPPQDVQLPKPLGAAIALLRLHRLLYTHKIRSPVKSSHHWPILSAHQRNAIIEIMFRWQAHVGPHRLSVPKPLSLLYNMKTIAEKNGQLPPPPPPHKTFWICPWKLQ